MSQYIVQGIFAVAGIISLLAAIFDWEWFFTARNTQFAVKSVGTVSYTHLTLPTNREV